LRRNSKSFWKIQIRQIVVAYFFGFLIIDIINGYLLNSFGDMPITFGQLIRGVFTMLLIYEIIASHIVNNYNKHIIYLLFITPVTIILYCFRDGSFKAFPLELVALIKPLFFLLLLYQVIKNYEYFNKHLNNILITNLLVYSGAIIISYVSGTGINAYATYYDANKSFFYASNATAVIGFSFTIYFTYKLKEGIMNSFYLALAVMALFISGSMLVLVYPFFLLYFLAYKLINKSFYKIITTSVMVMTIALFITGALNSIVFIDNALFLKYQDRAFHSINFFDKHSTINITPLRWYSYVSGLRAIRANTGLNNIINEPPSLTIGYGTAMRSKKVGEDYAGRTGSEMDFIDIFLDYGIIGFLLIYIPILNTIFPLIWRINTELNAMVIYFMFLYSSLAGHVITAPMGGALFALFLGIEYGKLVQNKDLIKKELAKSEPLLAF
tara:strand:- start:3790 stop:5109 length:1320 start_codon:yes stop_codon:yes gene_type:complete